MTMQYLSQRLAAQPARRRDTGPPRPALAGSQRERLLDATDELIAERGAAKASIEAIIKAAGVSSVTFYEHFRDKEECFLAAFDRAVEGLRAEIDNAVAVEASHGAVSSAATRPEQVRA